MENTTEQRVMCSWFIAFGAKGNYAHAFGEWVASRTITE